MERLSVRCTPVSGRDHVNDAVSPPLELAQQGGKHPGGLRLGVVKQHDAAVDLLDARQDQAQFPVRAHRQPVAGPDVGAEHHDVALAHAVEQSPVRGETGKAEERTGRIAAALAVEREFVGFDPAVDLGFRPGERHVIEQRMRIGMMADAVALARFHAEPIVQATELLLQERTPRDVLVARPRAGGGFSRSPGNREITPPVVRRFTTPVRCDPADAVTLQRPLHRDADGGRLGIQPLAEYCDLAVARRPHAGLLGHLYLSS